MLRGRSIRRFVGKRYACLPGWSWTEPCEERHANYIGNRGARVLVMQPDPAAVPHFEFIRPLIEDVAHVSDPLVALDARRVLSEMDRGDDLSVLAVDALMMGMLVRIPAVVGPRARRNCRRMAGTSRRS